MANLLDRGDALGFALEKWERAGLWIITRADADYPERLKGRLNKQPPHVLFGCGNRRLFRASGIAVVGSRDAGQEDLAYTESLGRLAADQGHSIVSGAARGVDETAMLGALRCKGTAIGVMASDLLRASVSMKYRDYIAKGDLMLVSTVNPEAGFTVGNAMTRNRYIYCLADVAVMVSSTSGRGGTWNGAIEGLKKKWVPLWVKPTTCIKSGNVALVQFGARWIPEIIPPLDFLLNGASDQTVAIGKNSREHPSAEEASSTATTGTTTRPEQRYLADTPTPEPERADMDRPASEADCNPGDKDRFYSYFLQEMDRAAEGGSLGRDAIMARWSLEKRQVEVWLKRGVEDKKLKKLPRPVTYISTQGQPSLLDDE